MYFWRYTHLYTNVFMVDLFLTYTHMHDPDHVRVHPRDVIMANMKNRRKHPYVHMYIDMYNDTHMHTQTPAHAAAQTNTKHTQTKADSQTTRRHTTTTAAQTHLFPQTHTDIHTHTTSLHPSSSLPISPSHSLSPYSFVSLRVTLSQVISFAVGRRSSSRECN